MAVNLQERLPLLDVFRVFMCLMIIVFHGAIHKFYVLPDNQILSHNLLTGAVYMDAFFILSGFLLFLLYGNRFDSISPNVSLKEFYLRRYTKIYAQYLALFVVIMAMNKINYIILPVEIIALQSFFPQLWNFAGNGGTWFISAILFSYLIFPFVAYLTVHNKKIVTTTVLLYLSVVYLTIFSTYFNIDHMVLYMNPLYRCLEFIIGMYVAKIYIISKKRLSVAWALLALFLMFYLIDCFYNFDFSNKIKFSMHYVYYACVTVPMFSFIIFVLAGYKNSGKSNKILSFLSELCFPLYIWNGIAQPIVKSYFMQTSHPFAYVLIFNFLFAIIAWIFIDKIVVRTLKKISIKDIVKSITFLKPNKKSRGGGNCL